jgi:predicted PurR-regulated permease PerM
MTTDPAQRRGLFYEIWKHVGKVFIVAVLIDVVYEIVVFRWVYPIQPFIVAIVLAVIPYLLIRGPVNRLARRRHPKIAEKKRDAA